MIPKFITSPSPNIYLTSSNWLVIDFETTNLDRGNPVLPENHLVHTSIYHSKKGWIRIEGNELELSKHLDVFYDVDFIVIQNAKFELGWLIRAGADIEKLLVYDTLLGDYCRAGNRKFKLDLDSIAKRYGVGTKESYVSFLIKNEVCPSIIPYHMLASYCDVDVEITLKVFLKQRELLKERGLLNVLYTKCLFTPVLADLESKGMFLDKQLVTSLHTQFVREHQEIITKLNKITGGINMASGPQKAHFIYEDLKFKELRNRQKKYIRNKPSKQFPEGAPKTDVDTLKLLKIMTKKQQSFMDLVGGESKLRKKRSTYTSLYTKACEEDGGHIHGRFNQSVLVTHGLSSSSPNLQNQDKSLKKVFTCRDSSWIFYNGDYKQLEYRVAGFLAQCPVVKHAIDIGEDPHFMSAYEIYGECKYKKDTEEYSNWRDKGKPFTFGPLYGKVRGTEKEQSYFKAFIDKHTGIREWHEILLQEALEKQKIVNTTGLVAYFPGTEYTKSGYIKNQTNIKNYKVQYLSRGEIAPIGTILLWHKMKSENMQSFLVNVVHDNVIAEVHPKEKEKLRNFSDEQLSKGVYKYLKQVYNISFNYKLDIDHEFSTNWSYNRR